MSVAAAFGTAAIRKRIAKLMLEFQKKFQDLNLWPYIALDKNRQAVMFSPCSQDDLAPLVNMYETFEPKASIQGLPPLDRYARIEWIKNTLRMGMNLKAEHGGIVIAVGSLFPMQDRPVVELGVFVHNEHQNRGLGTLIAHILMVVAKRLGFEKIWSYEERNNNRILKIYMRLGFRETMKEKNEVELELDLSQISSELDLSVRLSPPVVAKAQVKAPEFGHGQEILPDTRSIFFFSSHFDDFKLTPGHPFSASRSKLVYDMLIKYNLRDLPGAQIVEPEPLDKESLLAFHDQRYIYYLEIASQGAFIPQMLEFGLGSGDNPVIPGIIDYSLLAAGASVMGADILAGRQNVNLIFSPTGGFHHGGPNYASGFCYVNDVVLAIKYLLQKNLRVLYVDIDAHHGDGVQFAFYDEPRVLKISLHESGRTLFPWNSGFENELGEGDGYGYNINVPLAPGTEDSIYKEAFKRTVCPLAEAFKPDICVASVGVDAMYTDPLTHLSLTNNVYADVILEIRKLAPKLLMLGSGGYNPDNIARDWTLAWAVLHDAEPSADYYGLAGSMMTAAEVTGMSLRDTYPFVSSVKIADARAEAMRVISYLERQAFPIHGL